MAGRAILAVGTSDPGGQGGGRSPMADRSGWWCGPLPSVPASAGWPWGNRHAKGLARGHALLGNVFGLLVDAHPQVTGVGECARMKRKLAAAKSDFAEASKPSPTSACTEARSWIMECPARAG
jgi:hypothetical protein